MENNLKQQAFLKESKPIFIETLALIINERNKINMSGIYAYKGLPDVENPVVKTYKELMKAAQENNVALEQKLKEIIKIRDEELTLFEKEQEVYKNLFKGDVNTNIITNLYKNTNKVEEKVENNIHTIIGLMCKHGLINEKTATLYSGKIGVVSETYERRKTYEMMLNSMKVKDTSINIKTLPVSFNKGQLIIIAGEGGVGKTDYTLNLINQLKEIGGIDFFSLELTLNELGLRIATMCNAAVVKKHLDINGLSSKKAEVNDIEKAKEELSKWEKSVDIYSTTDYRKLAAIEQTIKRSDNQYAVIDFIGYVAPRATVGSWEDIDIIVKNLGRIAKDTNKTIFALSTFNGMDRSKISQINFSGGSAMRHEPHVLLGLQRHADDPNKVVLTVVKARSDQTGRYTIDYDRANKKFTNLIRDDEAKTE